MANGNYKNAMKANETHIGLETAMLLKDCLVKSRSAFWRINGEVEDDPITFEEIERMQELDIEESDGFTADCVALCPAYTWQEILLGAKLFFGEEWIRSREWYSDSEYKSFIIVSEKLLRLLQRKQYEEADLYFRKHCILIKN